MKPIWMEWKTSMEGQVPVDERGKTPSKQTKKRQRLSLDVSGSGLNQVIFLPCDTNELLNRHRLLFESMMAGNTGVFNEIQAINDQLYKLNIFDKELIESMNDFFSL